MSDIEPRDSMISDSIKEINHLSNVVHTIDNSEQDFFDLPLCDKNE